MVDMVFGLAVVGSVPVGDASGFSSTADIISQFRLPE